MDRKNNGGISSNLKNITENILFVLFSAMIIVVFINVVARYVFNSALTTSEEIARIAFVWLVFIGTTLALVENEHIGFDSVVNMLPQKLKKLVAVMANCLVTIILAIIAIYGVQLCKTNMSWPAPATGIPYGVIGSIVPISAAFMILILIKRTINLFKKQ